MERVLWIDAICINQANEEEKGDQIRSMAEVYSRASRVIVWLGDEADNGPEALEHIRVAAGKEPTDTAYDNQKVITLLQRPWFERIWVLQEIASARRIIIMCGSTMINGQAFCLGLRGLKDLETDNPGLQGIICSVIYIISGAISRPQHILNGSGEASLGELIDMYHTRKATDRRDKVYALLGMSSDDPSVHGLSTTYAIPWKDLMRHLVELLVPKNDFIRVFEEKEVAVIKSKGWVIGQISSVTRDQARYDRQQVNVVFTDTSTSSLFERKWGAQWTLQASAKSIRQGDIICLLEGATKPAVIRTYTDRFSIRVIAVTPLRDENVAKSGIDLQCSLHPPRSVLRTFLLVWSWDKPLENVQQQTAFENTTEDDVQDDSKDAARRAALLYDLALILTDVEEYEGAMERFQEIFDNTGEIYGTEHPYPLARREVHALTCKKTGRWEEAESMFLQIIETRQQMFGLDHPGTLNTIAHLASVYIIESKTAGIECDLTINQ